MAGTTIRGPSAWGGDGDTASPPAPADGPYVTTQTDALLPGATLIGAIILPPDLLANIPLATTVPAGALFFPTDYYTMYRSTGSVWTAVVDYVHGTAADGVKAIVALSQAAYDALTPVATTLYVIVP